MCLWVGRFFGDACPVGGVGFFLYWPRDDQTTRRSLEHGAYRGGAGGYRQSLLGDYPSDVSFVDCYGSVDPFCGRMRYLSGEDYYPAG